MVVLRLQRGGRHNRPSYRIVAADSKAPVKGKFIEIIGFYDPINKICKFDQVRVDHWVGVGAQMSDTVASLVKRGGNVELKERTKPNRKSIERKAREEEEKAAAEEAKKAEAEAKAQEEAAAKEAAKAEAEAAKTEEAPVEEATEDKTAE